MCGCTFFDNLCFALQNTIVFILASLNLLATLQHTLHKLLILQGIIHQFFLIKRLLHIRDLLGTILQNLFELSNFLFVFLLDLGQVVLEEPRTRTSLLFQGFVGGFDFDVLGLGLFDLDYECLHLRSIACVLSSGPRPSPSGRAQ